MTSFDSTKALFLLRAIAVVLFGFLAGTYGLVVPRYLAFWSSQYQGLNRLGPWEYFVTEVAETTSSGSWGLSCLPSASL